MAMSGCRRCEVHHDEYPANVFRDWVELMLTPNLNLATLCASHYSEQLAVL